MGRRDDSTGFFQELYAIVVGLGLALALEQIVDLTRSMPFRLEHAAVFLAYLNLAFALAHSSVRYLQLAYREGGLPLDRFRVVADLVLGVGQFLWLITLSFLITRPTAFAIGVIVLLVGRPIRDALLRATGRARLELDRKVASLHLLTIGMLGAALALAQVLPASSEELVMEVAALGAALTFGLGLYVWAFDFFFPSTGAVR